MSKKVVPILSLIVSFSLILASSIFAAPNGTSTSAKGLFSLANSTDDGKNKRDESAYKANSEEGDQGEIDQEDQSEQEDADQEEINSEDQSDDGDSSDDVNGTEKENKKKKEKEANENARRGLLNALTHLKGTPAEKVILDLLNLEDVDLEELLSQLEEYLGENGQTSVTEDTYGENVQTQTRLQLEALTKEQLSAFADALGAKLELQAQVREQTKLKKQLREIYEKMGETKKARDVQLSVIQEVYQNLDEYEKLGELYEKVQDKGVKAFVNGVQPAFDVPPIIKDDHTLVPYRAIAEALGADVKWDAETRTVTVSKGDTTVQLTIGSNVALVNGQEISLDVPASIIQGRTLVPARFLANALGAKVDWVPIGQIVVINASPDTTTTK